MQTGALQSSFSDSPLSIVLYRDRFSKHPIRVVRTWAEFADFIVNYVEASPCTVADGLVKCIGKKCPHKSHSSIVNNPMAWSPVEIDGLRRDKNVRMMTALVLDFDHVTVEQAAQIERALDGRARVTHTTHNNRDADLCFRVVLPLSRPVSANLWHKFLAAAIDFLGVTVQSVDKKGKVVLQPDRVCKNRDRLYYRPSHPKDAPHSAKSTTGTVVDVDAVLAHAATMPDPRDVHVRRELPEAASWNLESPIVEEAIDLIARHMPDRQRHELALALGGMLRAHGAAQEDAHYILHEGFLAGGSDAPEERAKTVEHTYALDVEAAMTGFTRVSEIIGVSEARDIGYCFAAAAQEEFFERLTDFGDEEARPALGGAPAPPPPSVNIKDVADMILRGAASRSRRDDRDPQILAVLLRRLIAGKVLAYPGGVGDVETVREGKLAGVDVEQAMCDVFFAVGVDLDQAETPTKEGEEALWGAVAQVTRASLAVTPSQPGKDWSKIARSNFFAARLVKLNDVRERVKLDAERAEIARAAVLPASSPPPLPTDPPDGSEWECLLTKTASGTIESTLDNARLLLTNHPDFRGYLRFNVVSKRVEATGGIPAALGEHGVDNLVVRLADHLTRRFRLSVDENRLKRRIFDIARRNEYDPIADYLGNLKWDGVPRLDVWLQVYCGAEQTSNAEYLKLVGRRWFIALAARGIEVSTSRSPSGPGCKVDYVLILESNGGVGKSSVFETLGADWFCDTAIDIGDKDSRMLASRYWICELPEIVHFKKSTYERLKAFWSQRKDSIRLPYGSDIEDFLRRCLFVGTTNDEHYFVDETGNRKYLPVACSYNPDQLAALRRDRDQLMAEAVCALRAGEKWWFDYEEIAITEAETVGRMVETPFAIKVEEWWYSLDKKDRPSAFTTMDVAEQALGMESKNVSDGNLKSVGHVIKRMGFSKKRDTTGTQRTYRYYATEKLMSAEKVEPRRRNLFLLPGGKKDEDKK